MSKPDREDTPAATPAAGALPDISCPLRKEVWAGLNKNARNLQCTPEMYLELLIEKGVRANVVTQEDVFLRTADRKFAASMMRHGRDQEQWRSWWGSLSREERESISQSLEAEARRGERSGVVEVWAPQR